MQWLQQFELLKNNLLALGWRRLVALGVVGAVVIGAVTAMGLYASKSETEPLYAGLGQADVARIGSALREAGIPFDVSADGTKVLVRRALAPNARMLLAEKGLPAGGTAGYELFEKLGPLGLTSFMQEVTRTRALEGELARTIQTMKGVKSARVHVVMPETSSFRRNRQPASASVLIRTEGAREPTAPQIIRHLVSAAVPGLLPENVTVMSSDGSVLAAGGDGSVLASTRLIELERSIGQQLQENIRRTLAPYLGVENFEVSAAARLNTDKRQVNEQVYDPDTRTERSTRVVKEASQAQNGGARPTVSVEQNVPTEQAGSAGQEQSKKSNERREELTNFELSSKTISTMSDGHRIEALNISIVVNRKRLVPATGTAPDPAAIEKQVKEIEAIASSAAGLDVKRGDKISVALVDFLDTPGDAASKPGILELLAMHIDTFIIAVTAMAATLILVWFGLLPAIRTIVSRPPEPVDGGMLTAEAAAPEVSATNNASRSLPEVQAAAPKALASSLNPTQSRLAELIERDEQQVAEVLKQWLARA